MISVVIPAFNEEKNIVACLDALSAQRTKQKFEVVVVDNNSTDKTSSLVRNYKNKLNVRVIFEKEKGRGAARARGFSDARAEIILSTDADTIVPPDWIEKMVTNLRSSSAVAVTGTCMINDCGFITNTLFNFNQPLFMRIYRLFYGHFWLSGFNFAIYKEAYKKSGGFDTKLNAQEDIDISMKVAKVGKIKFVRDSVVLFSGRRFKKGFLRGTVPYVTTFIAYFILGKEITLADVR